MALIKLYYDIRLLFFNYIRFSFQRRRMQQDNLNIKVMQSKERDAISTLTNYFCYRTLQFPEFILLSFLQVPAPGTRETRLLFFNAWEGFFLALTDAWKSLQMWTPKKIGQMKTTVFFGFLGFFLLLFNLIIFSKSSNSSYCSKSPILAVVLLAEVHLTPVSMWLTM